MSKYTISFQHTSDITVDSRKAALAAVKKEALYAVRPGHKGPLRHIAGEDGDYVYLNKMDAVADCDGSRAFAVISTAASA